MFCRVPGGTFKMWYLWPLPEDIIRRWFQCRDSCNPSLSYLLVQVELASAFLAASPLLSFQIFIYLYVCVCNCVCVGQRLTPECLHLFIFLLQNLDLLILIRLAGQSTQDPSASTYHHWANKQFFCAWLLRELGFWSWLQEYSTQLSLQPHLLPHPLLLPLSHSPPLVFNACVHAFKERVDIPCLCSWEA